MKIDSIEIIPYELNFRNAYKNAIMKIDRRSGWIIKISSNGKIGFGDASPLEFFSRESYEQSRYGLEGFKIAIESEEDYSFEELIKLSEAHGELHPSVEFAIDSAVYDLESKLKNISARNLISESCIDYVKVCEYEKNSVDQYDGMVVKVKIDDTNLFHQVDKLISLVDKYSCDIKFRLDFNGSYDLPRAIRICKMLESFPIDYIEQPLAKENYEDMYELSLHTDFSIAVDEMATNINSIYKILESDCADVFIVKPMLIGGIEKVHDIISLIKSENKRVNISSLLESNVGRLMYLHMCSAFQIDEENGIATNQFFESDLCEFPLAVRGCIKLDSSNGIGIDAINL